MENGENMNLDIRDLAITTVPQGPYIEVTIQGSTAVLHPSEVLAVLGLLNGFMKGLE